MTGLHPDSFASENHGKIMRLHDKRTKAYWWYAATGDKTHLDEFRDYSCQLARLIQEIQKPTKMEDTNGNEKARP